MSCDFDFSECDAKLIGTTESIERFLEHGFLGDKSLDCSLFLVDFAIQICQEYKADFWSFYETESGAIFAAPKECPSSSEFFLEGKWERAEFTPLSFWIVFSLIALKKICFLREHEEYAKNAFCLLEKYADERLTQISWKKLYFAPGDCMD